MAGLPTTAACPRVRLRPRRVVTRGGRLVAAGAVLVGKTNLDQFATGLVGTRSPYGVVRAAHHPDRVSGGSSSGSGAAVGLGLVDFALGTDTAGSGRVPAAFNGVVGIKPTLGLVPTRGVVPACADFDCVTVLAPTVSLAGLAMSIMIGPDVDDPRSRPGRPTSCSRPHSVLGSGSRSRTSWTCSPRATAAVSRRPLAQAEDAGLDIVRVDIAPLLAAARLLYDGALVAERFDAVGEFVTANPTAALDPTVAAIVRGSAKHAAHEFVRDTGVLVTAKHSPPNCSTAWTRALLPTTTEHPLVDDVLADRSRSIADSAPSPTSATCSTWHPSRFRRRGARGVVRCDDRDAGVRRPGRARRGPPGSSPARPRSSLRTRACDWRCSAHTCRDSRCTTSWRRLAGTRDSSGPSPPRTTTSWCDWTPSHPSRSGAGVPRAERDGRFRVSCTASRVPVSAPSWLRSRSRWGADGDDPCRRNPAVGFTCTPAAAATGADITEFGGWRASSRHPRVTPRYARSGPPGQIVNTANTMRTTPRNRARTTVFVSGYSVVYRLAAVHFDHLDPRRPPCPFARPGGWPSSLPP